MQLEGGAAQPLGAELQSVLDVSSEYVRRIVHMLAAGRNACEWTGAQEIASDSAAAVARQLKMGLRQANQPLAHVSDMPLPLRHVRHAGHGARRGRRSAVIGHEVGDREVGFMPDARDYGQARARYGPRHALLVEGPQVLQRATAARHQNDLRLAMRIQCVDGGGHLLRGSLSLNQRGRHNDLDQGTPHAQHAHDVAQRSARRRGHHAHDGRAGWDRPLARLVKQAFGFKARFELFEAQVKQADARVFDGIDVQLVVAARLIEAQPSVGYHCHAIAQWGHRGVLRAKEHALELSCLIFEREIAMARCGLGIAADLATHPDVVKIRVLGEEVLEVAR